MEYVLTLENAILSHMLHSEVEEAVLFHLLNNGIFDSLLILIIVLLFNLSHIFHIHFKSLVFKFSSQLLVLQTHAKARAAFCEPSVTSQP